MSTAYRKAMDGLYWLCVGVSSISLVLISFIIPWGVYTRYVLNSAASWPEPMAILLTIVLTFFGAAACYRARLQMRITVVTDRVPGFAGRMLGWLSEGLVGLLALFMAVWGYRLAEATWHQVIAEFPFLSVGLTYLPIPVGGLFLLFFVVERLTIGTPPGLEDVLAP